MEPTTWVALYGAVVATIGAVVAIAVGVVQIRDHRTRSRADAARDAALAARARAADHLSAAAESGHDLPGRLRALRSVALNPGSPTRVDIETEAEEWECETLRTVKTQAMAYHARYLSDAGLPAGHQADRNGFGWHLELADRIERRLVRLDEIIAVLRPS